MTTTLRETKSGWSARIRMGVGQRPWLPMPPMKAAEAESRRDRLQRLATEFVRAGKATEAKRAIQQCAAQQSPKAFEAAERAARRSLTEAVDVKPHEPRTFRDVAELWLTGDLHRLYPDDVKPKAEIGRQADRTMLAVFFPRLGSMPMAEITKADTDQAKRLVPAHLESSSRAVYLNRLRRVFRLAESPLELIKSVPLRGKLPRPESDRDFWYLYPAEVEQLLTCVEIPIEFRLLYGFLVHNGTRIGETLRLTWAHIDWQTGIVRLEKSWTKMKRGRTWRLDPDVVRALRCRSVDLGKPKTGPMFIAPDSREVIDRRRLQERFIADLQLAGITRPELLASNDGSRRLRLHDLRATLVTIARKVGRRRADGVEIVMTERWIMDRTGHETLGMLGKYERLVRHASDLDLDWFAPLDECLYPDVTRYSMDHSMDQNSRISRKHASRGIPIVNADGFSVPTEQPNSAAASRSNDTGQRLGPPYEGGVDQRISGGVTAVVTSPRLTPTMLQELLELATKGKRWHLVTALADELEALTEAASGNVVRLDPRRRK